MCGPSYRSHPVVLGRDPNRRLRKINPFVRSHLGKRLHKYFRLGQRLFLSSLIDLVIVHTCEVG